MQKTILAIVGLPGAGKTVATKYFIKKKIPTIRFGQIVNGYIDKHKLGHTKETHRQIWTKIRKDYGMEAFAILNEKKIINSLNKKPLAVVDGLRSWEEYIYLKKILKDVEIYILAIFTNKEIRYKRSAKRKYRANLFGEDRDISELMGMNMGPTIAMCDYLIVNNSSLKSFYNKLEMIYKQIK